jgi:hypothetical protein
MCSGVQCEEPALSVYMYNSLCIPSLLWYQIETDVLCAPRPRLCSDSILQFKIRHKIWLNLIPDHSPLLKSISQANEFRLCKSRSQETQSEAVGNMVSILQCTTANTKRASSLTARLVPYPPNRPSGSVSLSHWTGKILKVPSQWVLLQLPPNCLQP